MFCTKRIFYEETKQEQTRTELNRILMLTAKTTLWLNNKKKNHNEEHFNSFSLLLGVATAERGPQVHLVCVLRWMPFLKQPAWFQTCTPL